MQEQDITLNPEERVALFKDILLLSAANGTIKICERLGLIEAAMTGMREVKETLQRIETALGFTTAEARLISANLCNEEKDRITDKITDFLGEGDPT